MLRSTLTLCAAVALLLPAPTLAQEPPPGHGVVVGEVFDSTTMRPLEGARITLIGPGTRTVSDSDGRYRLQVPAGIVTLILDHPVLASLPIPIPIRELDVMDGETRQVHFHLPSLPTLLAAPCRRTPGGTLVGRVRDALVDRTLGRARVRILAEDDGAGTTPPVLAEATTAEDGTYRVCGLPAQADLRVEADFHGVGRHAVSVHLPPDRPVLLDFDLDITAPSRIVGRVIDAVSDRPVAQVAVRLQGPDQIRMSDEDGRFLFTDLAPGMYGIASEHIAYTAQVDSVAVGGNEVVELEVRLAAEVLELPPLVVLSRARPLIAEGHLSTFESRRRNGRGYFITRRDIERLDPYSITGLLRRVPGLRVVPNGWGTYSVLMARQPPRMNTLGQDTDSARPIPDPTERPVPGQATVLGSSADPRPARCEVRFYLDGGPVRMREGDSIDLLVPVQSVAGVEIYRGASELPAGIMGSDTRCGAILIWTLHG